MKGLLFLLLASVAANVSAADAAGRALEGHEMPSLVLPVIECTSEAPCGMCMGDCDNDNDCMDGLICYQKLGRAQSEEEAMVPGK